MRSEREEFRPVLDKDVMLDILADHIRDLSRKDQDRITKKDGYQAWAKNVAVRAFDYGYRVFALTEDFQHGHQTAETELYQAYAELLSETYRESFDCIQFIPDLPDDIVAFLAQAPSAFEPIYVPPTDFPIELNLQLNSEESFFDQKIKLTLDTINNLTVRSLAVKYATCHRAANVRMNTHIRDLSKLSLELISGHQMVLLYGASQPATRKVRDGLLSKFFDESDRLRILDYMKEGKMFSDEIFEQNKKAREALQLMTGSSRLIKPLTFP